MALVACGSRGLSGNPAPVPPSTSASPEAAVAGVAGVAGRSFEPAKVQAPVDSGPGPSASGAAQKAEGGAASGASPFAPQRLRLPSGRLVTVLPEGTQEDGRLAVPENPAVVGWWAGGSRPGDPYGTTVLAGHIDSRVHGVGALAELVTSRPGGTIVVAGTRQRRTYRVTVVTRVPKAELVPGTEAFDRTGPPRLVLITCGGRFDPATHHYADNVLVTAVPS